MLDAISHSVMNVAHVPALDTFPPAQSLSLARLDELVAKALSVKVEQLYSSTRSLAYVCRARQVAMYLAHVALGLSLTEVSNRYGRDRTTVTYTCHVIEDKRDDKDFDTFLDDLEKQLNG